MFQLELKFRTQKEIATRLLKLSPSTDGHRSGNKSNVLQGTLSVIRNGDRDRIVLGETIYFPLDGTFDEAFMAENNAASKRAVVETGLIPAQTSEQPAESEAG